MTSWEEYSKCKKLKSPSIISSRKPVSPPAVIQITRRLKGGDDNQPPTSSPTQPGTISATPASLPPAVTNRTNDPGGEAAATEGTASDNGVVIGSTIGAATIFLSAGVIGFIVYNRRKGASAIDNRRKTPDFGVVAMSPASSQLGFGGSSTGGFVGGGYVGYNNTGMMSNGLSYSNNAMIPTTNTRPATVADSGIPAPPPRTAKPLTMGTVVYNYQATKPGELTLFPGETVSIIGRPYPGWYQGRKMQTGESGIFPDQCVQA